MEVVFGVGRGVAYILIMVDLSKYSSERLMGSSEKQLKHILKEFKEEQMPAWKFGLFVTYNALALVGMYFYGVRLRGKRVAPSLAHRHKLSIANLFNRGVQHGAIMIALYLAGLFAVCHNTISFPLLRKLTEIQSTYHSFGLKFDPSYQEHLLFSRMRKFQLSEALIQEIQEELAREKEKLIAEGGLLPETIQRINEVEQLFKSQEREGLTGLTGLLSREGKVV